MFFAQGSLLLTGQLLAAAFSMAEAVILARSLGVAAYGELAIIVATVLVVMLVIDVRVWETSTRYAAGFLAERRTDLARTVLALSIVVNAVGGILATVTVLAVSGFVAANLLDQGTTSEALRIYALIAPFTAISIATSAILRVLEAYRLLVALTVAVPLLRVVAVGIGVASGLGLEGLLGVLVAAEATATIGFTVLTMRTLAIRLPTKESFATRVRGLRPHSRSMLRFMAWSNAVGTVRSVNERVDVLIVGAIATPATAGVFKIARTFTQPLGMIVKPYYQVIYPQLARAASSGDLGGVKFLAYRSMAPVAAVLVPAALLVGVLAPFLIPVLVGSSFEGAGPAAAALILGWMVAGILFWVYPVALALGAQKVALAVVTLATALQVIALVLLVPPLGAVGAGLAWSVLNVTFALGMVAALRRRLSAAPGGGPSSTVPRYAP